MTDVNSRLARLNKPAADADPATVAADLTRCRRALRRRRLIGGATGVVAIAAAATVAVATTGSDPAPSPGTAAIRLVSYTGDQLPGFRVAQVPEGYVLQGASAGSLDIARPGDTTSIDDFQHKVVVMLQSVDSTPATTGTKVDVNGHRGFLNRSEDGVRTVEYNDGEHDVLIQCWSDIRLTDAQLVQFAEGVTVTAAAQAGHG